MKRTPKAPSPVIDRIRLPMEVLGWMLVAYTMISAAIKLLLHVSSWIGTLELATSLMLGLLGLLQMWVIATAAQGRADRAQKASRLFFPVGVVLCVVVIVLPNLVAAAIGLLVCFGLLVPAYLVQMFKARRRSRPARYSRDRQKPTLLLRCRIVPLLGLIGAMTVYGFAFGASLPQRPGRGKKPSQRHGHTRPKVRSRQTEEEWTYEENCTKLPDPLEIGHGLGELFRRDGAVKAGCGSKAREVPGTSTWISLGICGQELRSLAISGPEGEPSIVYGEAAAFAWEKAQQGQLAGAETRGPAGGDFDLIWTFIGTYAFVREHQERVKGNENTKRCDEVGGEPELFVRLNPPLVGFWKELTEKRAEWLWPSRDASGASSSVAFLSSAGETVATGACTSSEACQFEFEGPSEPIDGSSYLHINDFEPFVPAEEDGKP
jgi:hypothetical protein